jgi:hypothetical protein
MRMIWIVSLGGIYLSMTAEKIFIYAASKHKFKEEATTACAVVLWGRVRLAAFMRCERDAEVIYSAALVAQ